MTKGKRKGKYDKAREKAYRYYFQRWRGNEGVTPAFGQKVLVTRSGWDHLVNPSRKRTKVEQTRRFEVLPLARKLLEEAQTFQEHRVVVRSKTMHGQKYFFSLMIVL